MAYNQYASVAEETTWGSPVTRTKFMKVYEGSYLEHMSDTDTSAAMGGNAGADPEFVYVKGQRGEGKISLPVSYDDQGILVMLKHAFGLYAFTAGSPAVHTFTRKAGPPFGAGSVATAAGLSVELNYELGDTNLAARLREGGLVNSLALGWSAGEEIKADFELIGEQVTQIAKTGYPTFPTYDTYMQNFTQAAVSVNSTDDTAVMTGFDFKMSNGYEPVITLGSYNTKQPRRKGKSDISGTIKMLWDGASSQAAVLWGRYKANTTTAIVATITGPTNYSWTFTLNSVKLTSATLTQAEGQLQECEFGYKVINDSSNTACKLVVNNTGVTI